ncbi:pre-mRNA 3' end processing protein WDR33 [Thelohanellus kitauei]|uniref:Pre-mRNA 3' end processing protein WDR33 n=1 Tax=Thelohanellus kitauei TaxID=669202 RepID=A0A0C2N3N4_THEKT|nr:pre-mRNA 3' end processing protein WDR33 [Thelohanellus kitauei]
MKELQAFRGHKKEAYNVSWHTVTDNLLSSGGGEGCLMHWHLGDDKEIGSIESAHDGVVWEVAWHPEGHIVASVSNDHACKFWGRKDPQSIVVENRVESQKTQGVVLIIQKLYVKT